MGRMFLASLHIKVLILFGIGAFQISFHNLPSLSVDGPGRRFSLLVHKRWYAERTDMGMLTIFKASALSKSFFHVLTVLF